MKTDMNMVLPRVFFDPTFSPRSVVINDHVCLSLQWKQYRFPVSKKKRIRRKWAKQLKNYRNHVVHKIYEADGKVFVSSTVFEILRENCMSADSKMQGE